MARTTYTTTDSPSRRAPHPALRLIVSGFLGAGFLGPPISAPGECAGSLPGGYAIVLESLPQPVAVGATLRYCLYVGSAVRTLGVSLHVRFHLPPDTEVSGSRAIGYQCRVEAERHDEYQRAAHPDVDCMSITTGVPSGVVSVSAVAPASPGMKEACAVVNAGKNDHIVCVRTVVRP